MNAEWSEMGIRKWPPVNDVWGRAWPGSWELCPVCHQPDNCGDCNHDRISDEDRLDLIFGAEVGTMRKVEIEDPLGAARGMYNAVLLSVFVWCMAAAIALAIYIAFG